jgi:hypothetical protein
VAELACRMKQIHGVTDYGFFFAPSTGRFLAGMALTRTHSTRTSAKSRYNIQSHREELNIICGAFVYWRKPEPGSAFPTKAAWFASAYLI